MTCEHNVNALGGVSLMEQYGSTDASDRMAERLELFHELWWRDESLVWHSNRLYQNVPAPAVVASMVTNCPTICDANHKLL
jgi:hypothetical protein